MIIHDIVFPLFGGRRNGDKLIFDAVLGTSFKIEGGVFITAEHVLRAALEYEIAFVGYVNDQNVLEGELIKNHKLFPELDIATFEADIARAKELKLINTTCLLGESIEAIGFPYAMHLDMETFSTRIFKGHITSINKWKRLPANPEIYELSFQCPKGLSGAPLVVSGSYKCYGLVIGNSIVEMPLFEEREVTNDVTTTIYEKTQSMYLGLAIKSSFIRNYLDERS